MRLPLIIAVLFVVGQSLTSPEPVESAPRKVNCHKTDSCPTTTTTAPTTTTTTAPATTTTTAPTVTTTTTMPITTTTTAPPPSPTSCSGVSVTPGMDIQAAVNAYPNGTTFCFAPGVYRLSQQITPKSYDSFIAQPGAVLNGSRLVSAVQSGSSWVVTGQTQQAQVYYNPCTGTDPSAVYPEGLYLDDVSLRQVTSLSALAPGKFFFDYANDRIYLADNPTGRKLEASIAPGAIVGYSTGQTNVTVRGFLVEKFTTPRTNGVAAAIKAGNSWVIENNEVRFAHAGGVDLNTGGRARNNHLHHNGQYGITGAGNDMLVENNEVAYNNTDGYDPGCDAGGSKFLNGQRLTARGNYIHHNTGPGLWSDGDNIYVTYENNRIEYNTNGGIAHELGYDAVIRNNTVSHNFSSMIGTGKSIWWGGEIALNDAQNVEIYGNTIDADVHGITLVDTDRGTGTYGTYRIYNDRIHDNIIKMRAGGQTGMVGNRGFTKANATFQSNTYYVPSLLGQHWQWQGNLTMAQWQLNALQDTLGVALLLG